MSSYLDQTRGFVFMVGIGYLHKSYDEHGLEKNRVHYVWGRRSAHAMSRLIEFEHVQQILEGMNQTERLVFLRAKELTSLFRQNCMLTACVPTI